MYMYINNKNIPGLGNILIDTKYRITQGSLKHLNQLISMIVELQNNRSFIPDHIRCSNGREQKNLKFLVGYLNIDVIFCIINVFSQLQLKISN